MLLLAHLGLLGIFDLTAHLPLALGFLAMGFVGLVYVDLRLGGCRLSPATILLVAAALRLLLLPLPPTLSDDILRYLWDGRAVVEGHNPYLHAPEADAVEPLRDSYGGELWERLDHRDVPTVYPPLAQGVFALGALAPLPLGGGVLVLKVILSLLDLAACGCLVYLAGHLRVPSHRVLAYAWNPLVTLEVAGMGHIDALGVAAVIVAVTALVAARGRSAGAARSALGVSAAAAAAGVLAKLAPLVALPMWARLSHRPVRYLAVAGLVTVVGILPMVLGTGGVPPGLVRYGVSWEFNGPVYEPLWRLLDKAGVSARVETALDRIKERDGHRPFWNRFYPYNYPQFLAKLLLGLGLAAVAAYSLRTRDPAAGTGALFGGLLLFSATVYPWYLLWVLPWAALCRQRAWLALSALLPLSYLASAWGAGSGPSLMPWIFLAIWVPFFLLLAKDPRWRAP